MEINKDINKEIKVLNKEEEDSKKDDFNKYNFL